MRRERDCEVVRSALGKSLNGIESGDCYYAEHTGTPYNAILVGGGGIYIYIK